jgi:hypothetical protein
MVVVVVAKYNPATLRRTRLAGDARQSADSSARDLTAEKSTVD